MWRAPQDLQDARVLVLAWTSHFFGPDYLRARTVALAEGRQLELEFTTDRSRISEADAVWFHGPSVTDFPQRKQQPWVLMSMESDVNYPALRNPLVQLRFDLIMSYRLDSDVPCIYPNWRHYGTFLDRRARHRGPSAGALALYVASHPVPERDRYVQALQQFLPVDCPGPCLNNTRLPGFVEGTRATGAWDSLLAAISRYKFYIAFENSSTVDYVTERAFQALACGVVPVYRGAVNVRDFMPADDAVIDTADFTSPRELAAYLRHLDNDDAAYARHLAWKETGYSGAFSNLVDLGSVDPMDRLAVKLAHRCGRECRCGGRCRDPGERP